LDKSLLLALALAGATTTALAQTAPKTYGFGKPATPAQIAGWDIDVRPDGHGVKRGRGSVEQGQVIYDAKCASCHGTFGESNNYIVIAGGVEKDDLKTGRAASLKSGEIRTLGNKLNYATTLWDYIYRAMPWTNPQSLTPDEVYAVTAYVLHLNDIVPADFVLDDKTLLTLPMPNRYGFTTAHGMGSVKGKPDVQGSACMSNCAPGEAKIVSVLPEFARNAHGNLALQVRGVGPTRGIDTSRYEAGKGTPAAAAPVAGAKPASNVEATLKANGCIACHGVNSKVVGPAYREVAAKYRGKADAQAYLVKKMREGGSGVWGAIPMPPQAALKEADAQAIAQWILAGAP
jgi:S-disulfanyl-L-cysteine oxidoreductase SoxD